MILLSMVPCFHVKIRTCTHESYVYRLFHLQDFRTSPDKDLRWQRRTAHHNGDDQDRLPTFWDGRRSRDGC